MIYKIPSSETGLVHIVFELPACIWADSIYLVGDFNGWGTDPIPFSQGRDGVWRASVDLPAGERYQFRYLVDGSWQTDYHADGWTSNEYGSQNSIVETSLDTSLDNGGRTHRESSGLVHETRQKRLHQSPKQHRTTPVFGRQGSGRQLERMVSAAG